MQARIFGGGFDFSRGDCGCPPCLTPCSYTAIFTSLDMYWVAVFDPPIGESLDTPFGGIPLGDVVLDSIHVAPTTGYVGHIGADINEELQLGHVYVVRTREGGHAVFRIMEFDPGNAIWVIDYKLQTDGSGHFEEVAVERMSWSLIKAITH